jgi:hypothetical protein
MRELAFKSLIRATRPVHRSFFFEYHSTAPGTAKNTHVHPQESNKKHFMTKFPIEFQ